MIKLFTETLRLSNSIDFTQKQKIANKHGKEFFMEWWHSLLPEMKNSPIDQSIPELDKMDHELNEESHSLSVKLE